MAGHSQFKNRMHRKEAVDVKKAKLFTKLIGDITVAIQMKEGDVNPVTNPRLRTALSNANKANLPKSNIDKVIQKIQTNAGGSTAHYVCNVLGITILVECFTDNRNRTASLIRENIRKFGGSMQDPGSIKSVFQHKGLFYFSTARINVETLCEKAIEQGAEDLVIEGKQLKAITSKEIFSKFSGAMNTICEPNKQLLAWISSNTIAVSEKEKLESCISLLLSCQDVTRIWSNGEGYTLCES